MSSVGGSSEMSSRVDETEDDVSLDAWLGSARWLALGSVSRGTNSGDLNVTILLEGRRQLPVSPVSWNALVEVDVMTAGILIV